MLLGGKIHISHQNLSLQWYLSTLFVYIRQKMEWLFIIMHMAKWLDLGILSTASSFSEKQGGYSQNFLRNFFLIFLTLGLSILRFYRPEVFFQSKYQ
jgi:hypothetical protein